MAPAASSGPRKKPASQLAPSVAIFQPSGSRRELGAAAPGSASRRGRRFPRRGPGRGLSQPRRRRRALPAPRGRPRRLNPLRAGAPGCGPAAGPDAGPGRAPAPRGPACSWATAAPAAKAGGRARPHLGEVRTQAGAAPGLGSEFSVRSGILPCPLPPLGTAEGTLFFFKFFCLFDFCKTAARAAFFFFFNLLGIAIWLCFIVLLHLVL